MLVALEFAQTGFLNLLDNILQGVCTYSIISLRIGGAYYVEHFFEANIKKRLV